MVEQLTSEWISNPKKYSYFWEEIFAQVGA